MRNKLTFQNTLPFIVSISLHLAIGFGMVVWGRQFLKSPSLLETKSPIGLGENAIHIIRLNDVAVLKSKPATNPKTATSAEITTSSVSDNSYFSRIASLLVSEPFAVSDANLKNIELTIRFQIFEGTSTKNDVPAKMFYLVSVRTVFDSNPLLGEGREKDSRPKSIQEASISLKDQVIARLRKVAEMENMELRFSPNENPLSAPKNSPVFELPIRL